MKRKIIVEGDVAHIRLTKGFVALIDAADIHLVEGNNWHVLVPNKGRTPYAVRNTLIDGEGPHHIYLHRTILGVTDRAILVDHKDGDGLNCRRINLRECSSSENLCNRGAQRNNASGYKGVSWHAGGKKWVSQITIPGSGRKHLGLFDTPEEAAAVYQAAAEKFHGAFARTV